MRAVLSTVRDSIRAQLWPLPLLAVIAAVVGGILLPRLDGRVDGSLPSWLSSVFFGGDASAARTLLDSISSSLITVTSLTFSLTVVTLQLASGQFSPRLLRTFTSDAFVQATLGLFLATFIYPLTVLRSVRDGSLVFVPRIAVTVSFVLAVLSVIGLVLFLAHLARQIRVETMLHEVHEDASATLSAVLGDPRDGDDRRAAQPRIPDAPSAALAVLAPCHGFVIGFDERDLLDAACAADAVVVIDAHPGSSLVRDTPLGSAWGRGRVLSSEAGDRLRRDVGDAVRTGVERTAGQDVGFGLRQLTDVANKALSPGINDPTTAVHALGHIAALLCDLADHDPGPRVLCDPDGVARVWLRRPDLAELVDTSIAQPRRYGASDPQVLHRIFRLLEQLAYRSRPRQHHVVVEQLDRLRATVAAEGFDDVERQRLSDAGNRVTAALTRSADAA